MLWRPLNFSVLVRTGYSSDTFKKYPQSNSIFVSSSGSSTSDLSLLLIAVSQNYFHDHIQSQGLEHSLCACTATYWYLQFSRNIVLVERTYLASSLACWSAALNLSCPKASESAFHTLTCTQKLFRLCCLFSCSGGSSHHSCLLFLLLSDADGNFLGIDFEMCISAPFKMSLKSCISLNLHQTRALLFYSPSLNPWCQSQSSCSGCKRLSG